MHAEISFDSHGTRCAAWHLVAGSDALASPRGKPCVVMAHGFGATRDGRLLPFAEQFAAAGADVLVFDYRGYGASEGKVRQHVSHWRQRQDYHAAIARARLIPGVDPDRIIVWGSSYSGGHVVPVAVRDGRVAGVISQAGAMDGLTAALQIVNYGGPMQLAKLIGHGLIDLGRWLTRRSPHLISVVGPEHTLATISAPGSLEGYGHIMGPTFRNEMPARGALFIPLNRPVRSAAKLSCPTLLILASQDNICPPASGRRTAAKAGAWAEVHTFACGHFDVYVDEVFEQSVATQVKFLTGL